MHPNRSMRYALQVAVCGICLKPVEIGFECWRADRAAGGLSHVVCIAVVLADDPPLSAAELADAVNAAAAELCARLCENPAHSSTSTECRHDVEMLSTVGCSPDRDEEWAADHFHAVIGGEPCSCRHATAREANAAHGAAEA